MTLQDDNYIRFDWAIKRLLRNKANHAVLEGFLSTLIGGKIKIQKFLESEGNQEDEDDKYNRVDILAEFEDGELTIIEVQNNREQAYFHRMLYGVSKAITEYLGLNNPYEKVRKVYSVNIVYFDLGQGSDYVYHGKTTFKGMHEPHDTLKLSIRQNEKFFGVKEKDINKRKEAGAIFPEYYVLRVNDFDKVSKDPLDEWVKFLKTGKIDADATAAGLPEARECLRVDSLSAEDKQAYIRHMEAVRHMRSLFDTSRDEGYEEGRAEGLEKGLSEGRAEGLEKGLSEGRAEGLEKGLSEGRAEGLEKGLSEGRAEGELSKAISIARNLKRLGLGIEQIMAATGLSEEQLKEL